MRYRKTQRNTLFAAGLFLGLCCSFSMRPAGMSAASVTGSDRMTAGPEKLYSETEDISGEIPEVFKEETVRTETAVYLGIVNYGAPETNRENMDHFRYRFLICDGQSVFIGETVPEKQDEIRIPQGHEEIFRIDNGKRNTGGDYDYPIQNRLKETQGLKTGDTYILYDQKLKEHIVTVKGVYDNYVGRTMIMSRDGYEGLYGKKAVDNIYLIHLNGADQAKVEKEILSILPDATIGTDEKLHEDFVDIENSYNTVVLLLTGLAILMSIFVLANLTNIFVSRRRKELVIMRVNGFSMKQGIGYLIRETLTTTLLGFVIAVGLGGTISLFLVRLIEQPDAMLDRRFMPLCWVAAILLEGLFAACINAFVFRKVRNIKVTDINN